MNKKVKNTHANPRLPSDSNGSKNKAYWLTKTVEERLAEAERLRREAYPEYDKLKLERVVKIINRKPNRK